jgi:hypothetical protein
MKMKKLIVVAIGGAFALATFSYSVMSGNKSPVAFFKGHTHFDGQTHGAPEHSGGLDRNGCHNASVPYHCH